MHAARPDLIVGVDHAAFLRQRGLSGKPNLARIAELAVQAGAGGIAMRLFIDHRGIQVADLDDFIQHVDCPLSVAISPDSALLESISRFKLATCCIVPERRHEHSTGGAYDAVPMRDTLRRAAECLDAAGIESMVFVDPDAPQIEACAAANIRGVCLNTGAYALATTGRAVEARLAVLERAASQAASLGLKVRARGGLDYDNVAAVAAIGDIAEIEIGHAIFAQALFVGIASSVADLQGLLARKG